MIIMLRFKLDIASFSERTPVHMTRHEAMQGIIQFASLKGETTRDIMERMKSIGVDTF